MKVDVVINVYGKPWQTLCSLKSLMLVSGKHIDKIYFIEEKQQPYNENVSWVTTNFDNIIHYIPEKYSFTPSTNTFGDLNIPENRYNFRYQYGIEKSDKKYIFIMHNDMFFKGDIIGDMLSEIGNSVGCGSIGQCWNCPAFKANECDSERFYSYNPTYEEIIETTKTFKPARGVQFINLIDKTTPMPLPECRLNEFACLIDIEVYKKTTFPNGHIHLFGCYDGIDISSSWFRDVILSGDTIKNYDINKTSIHCFYSTDCGYQTQLNNEKYADSESRAKEFYKKNLTNI